MLSRLIFRIVAITFIALPLAAPYGIAADLVVFDRSAIAEVKGMGDVTVFAKLDDMAAALIEPARFSDLLRIDPSAKVVQSPGDLEFLYLALKDGPTGGATLLETEHRLLLKLTKPEAKRLMSQGARLVKCLPFDLPPDKPFLKSPEIGYMPGLTTDLDSLLALVSVDSVRSYVQRLQDFRTRYTGTDSFWAASDWISQKFSAWGYSDLETQYFSFWGNSSCNVIASKLGTVYPDRVIIVGGHFDSVVYDGGDPTIYAPGADDNASGTALAMEIARVLRATPFKKTVRFIAFGAEEQGLWGSQAYVNRALGQGENIEVMINADMIGNLADSYLDFNVRCNRRGVPYGEILFDIASQYTTLLPQMMIGDFNGSDHYPFGEAGFRTVYSDEGDFSPNWHFQTDIISNMNIPYMTDIVRSNLGLLVTVIGAPPPITELAAYSAGDGHTVYLSWENLADPEIVGYEVYQGYTANTLAIIDTVTIPADTIRGLAEDTTLYYAVASLSADGWRSVIDNAVSVTPRSRPISPDTLIVEPEYDRLRVSWTASTDLDFSHYQIWRRIGPVGDYAPIAQPLIEPEFIDVNLQPNTRYYYYATVVDTTELVSDPSPADYAKLLTLDSGILMVDEYLDGPGSQGQPNDAQQDSIYAEISRMYDVDTYDIQDEGLVRINELGAYSTVVYIDDDPTSQRLLDVQSSLERYLSLGGNLMYTGWRTFYIFGNGRPMTFAPGDFPYDYLKISSIYGSTAIDFSGATGLSGWPDLHIFPGRVLVPWNGRLLGVDVFTLRPGATPIYTYNSFSGDTLLQGQPVGIVVAESTWNIAYFSFPFYALETGDAREAFNRVMNIFGEQTSISDDGNTLLPEKPILIQNYPNPFNAQTSISYTFRRPTDMRLEVFDLLGRKVATLIEERQEAGEHSFVWDAADKPSGIYFARLVTNEGSGIRKMVLLK